MVGSSNFLVLFVFLCFFLYMPTQPCPWPGLINSYTARSRLHKLIPYLPLQRDKLAKSHFTSITLNSITEIGLDKFLNIIPTTASEWANLVNQSEIINRLESDDLLCSHIYLSELYLLSGRFEDSLKIQLKNKDPVCFETINRFNLDSKVILENMDCLIDIDHKECCKMLLNRADLIQPFEILQKTKKDEFLHEFLSSISLHKIGSNEVLKKKIELCGKYNQSGLFSLLRALKPKLLSDEVFLIEISNILKNFKDCINESVWLLGLQNKISEALELLVVEKRDIQAAVVFAKEWNGFDLQYF